MLHSVSPLMYELYARVLGCAYSQQRLQISHLPLDSLLSISNFLLGSVNLTEAAVITMLIPNQFGQF